MIVNGWHIREEIKKSLLDIVKKIANVPSLAVFVVDGDLATEKFIALKKSFAEAVGIQMIVKKYSIEDVNTQQLVEDIRRASEEHEGVVVQFPIPQGIDKDVVRNAVPASHDVDTVSDQSYLLFEKGKPAILPPVIGAIKEILDRNKISLNGKSVVVVGDGRLVGKPAAVWALQQGAHVETVNEKTQDISFYTKKADILILGAGVPGLIKPDMVKDGVIILDAGTSEARGKLRGDVDPACAEKALLFTPVPGGIGPITVAMIFRNLLTLSLKVEE